MTNASGVGGHTTLSTPVDEITATKIFLRALSTACHFPACHFIPALHHLPHTASRSASATPWGARARRSRCCRDGGKTQNSMPGPVQKMVLLRAAKGPGVPVRHWRPERSPGLMVPADVTAILRRQPAMVSEARSGKRTKTSDADWSKDWSGTRRSVTQRDRSCMGKTTERGTVTCLTGCREAATYLGTATCPGRSHATSGRIGSVAWSNHGAEGPA